jgi:hypothetical protein
MKRHLTSHSFSEKVRQMPVANPQKRLTDAVGARRRPMERRRQAE